MYKISVIFLLITATIILSALDSSEPESQPFLKGMNISCQTWGYEWATPEMNQTLVELQNLGVNSFSIHPYARVYENGNIKYSTSLEQKHISVPLNWAKEKNMKVMLKPHLAYWGTKFSWRGDINFNNKDEWQRFFEDYKKWIVIQAMLAEQNTANIFCIGVEYHHSLKYENEWRAIISEVKKVYSGKLTYAANWDTYQKVKFWDALDYVGIQAYFPLTDKKNPSESELKKGWAKVNKNIMNFSHTINKQIIFTELGYNDSEHAGAEPWSSHHSRNNTAKETQARCLKVALEETQSRRHIAGVFLWKWFPEIKKFRWRQNFNLQTPKNKRIILENWGTNY